ncbi:MAG: hypothetical protein HW386_1562 [Gammaproteobacteria bacterium]|nr:hypothetical protein [Gammaproteobacteria bacterium]
MRMPNNDRMNIPAYLSLLIVLTICQPVSLPAQDQPWLQDPVVMEVIGLRQQETAAMLADSAGTEADKYSSTFIANTPDRGVIPRAAMVEFLKSGTVKYDAIDMNIEYAGRHGDDVVVIMGVETVVPGAGMRDAGKRVQRRFTDVYRKENGVWRHDLRHANVVKVE